MAYATGDQFAGASGAWKHYSTGWRFVVRDRRRNLVYLSPGAGAWMASYAFGDAATAAARQAGLPLVLIRSLVAANVYPEGRPVRLTVKTAADLAVARKLFAIKFAH